MSILVRLMAHTPELERGTKPLWGSISSHLRAVVVNLSRLIFSLSIDFYGPFPLTPPKTQILLPIDVELWSSRGWFIGTSSLYVLVARVKARHVLVIRSPMRPPVTMITFFWKFVSAKSLLLWSTDARFFYLTGMALVAAWTYFVTDKRCSEKVYTWRLTWIVLRPLKTSFGSEILFTLAFLRSNLNNMLL